MFSIDIEIESQGYEALVEFLSKAKGIEQDRGLIEKLTARGLKILIEEAEKVKFVTKSNANYVASMTSRIEDYCTGVLYSTSDHAAYNEFGTGVVGLGSDTETIRSATGISYDDGWHYYDEVEGRWRYTRGQKGQYVFYKTILRLQQEIPMLVRDYVDDYFRQIGG